MRANARYASKASQPQRSDDSSIPGGRGMDVDRPNMRAGAVLLILELNTRFGGVVRIAGAPTDAAPSHLALAASMPASVTDGT